MLPDAGLDLAEALGTQIRTLLAEGLTDGASRQDLHQRDVPIRRCQPDLLLRAGDQALYAAK